MSSITNVYRAFFIANEEYNRNMKIVYLGSGGFWLAEAVYKRIRGVEEVIPGYMGGTVENPSHEIVATGSTGHAEVVKVIYDENQIGLHELLQVFFALHDSVAPAHAMHGVGSQYRSVIFYTDDGEAEAVDERNGQAIGVIPQMVAEVQAGLPEGVSVATSIMTATVFYPADQAHYDYYGQHADAAFSVAVIEPKLQELRGKFSSLFS